MKTGNEDRVLYQIRATPPRSSVFQSSTKESSRPRTIIFNGISANSWLLPIGISRKDIVEKKQRSSCVKTAKSVEPTDAQNEAKQEVASVQEEEDESVSCETAKAEEGTCSTTKTRPLTASEFDSLWERVPPRPKSTGSVYIIRNRQLPVGLGKHECLQGQRLSTRSAPNRGNGREDTTCTLPFQRKPRPYTAPGRRTYGHSRVDRICLTPTWRPLSQGRLRTSADFAKQDVDSSLDLVVTSLDLNKDSSVKSSCGDNDHGYSSHDVGGNEGRTSPSHVKTPTVSKSSPRSSAKSTNSGFQRDTTDTIQGIKRSYSRRAKSAPPNVRTSALSASHDHSDPTSSSRGPSLYWRAKSTYHKKLMAFGPEGNGPVDPNEDTPNLRGSFWRPLMVPEDGGLVMQHSSGCPYKCKGCFKACLVSEDYLQKARAQKLLREQEQKRTADSSHRPTTLAHFKRKVKDARDIVNTALARSQPLYKMVHGDKEEHQSNPSERDKENCAEPSVTGNTDDISGVDTQGPIGGIAEDPTMQNVSGSVLNEEKNESGGVAKLSSGGGVGENGAVETRQAWMEEEKQAFPDSQ